MTELRDPESGRRFTAQEAAWIGDHLSDLRHGVAERRFRVQTLLTGLVIGLVVHVAAYLLRTFVSGEPAGLVADLLYALGYALWTGVVVVILVEIIPAAKERQVSRWLDAYEAAVRSSRRVDGGAGPGPNPPDG
jgi:hypothetical protein